MTAVLLTPPGLQFFDNNGAPLAGGLLYTYAAGTTTPQATYTDQSGIIPASNPVVLDAAGRANVWISGSYKFVLKDSLGNTINTLDNVTSFSTAGAAPGSLSPNSIKSTQTSIASNSTTDLGTIASQNVLITGTTTITSFGLSASLDSPLYWLEFGGSLVLTNSTTLALPGSANITTSANDTAVAEFVGTGWRIRSYMRAANKPSGGGATTFQYLTSGTSATYTTPPGCTAILVKAVAGGGGGGARATNTGSAGGNTIFNSVTAVGGGGGGIQTSPTGGAGGTGGTGTANLRIAGAYGGGGAIGGQNGGSGPWGGAGTGNALNTTTGTNASANGGSGGAGAAGASSSAGGSGGGGAGEYFELYISSPASSYTYTIGSAGTGGAAGTLAGGNGSAGLIIVQEYYS